jgi:uncharacterized protein (TIGR03437 family)
VCASATGAYKCLASGINSNSVPNGVIGTATLTLSSAATTAAIGVTNPLAASLAGGAISVTSNGGSVSVSSALSLASLACTPASLNSGAAATCTVTLSRAAVTGGASVTLSDNSANLTVPASVAVPAGSTSATFRATAGTITSTQSATVTATYGGASKTATLSLTGSSNTTLTIWPSSAQPANIDSRDTQAVELGVKFRSTVAGTVTGVRFYKASTNTGTHVGHLWSKSGSLLATVTFSGETASGWQQASFPAAVAISANTTYVISYRAPAGHYSYNANYFQSSAVTNGPLTALQNGTDGGNGVYKYGTTGFPSSTYRSNNYWVDVVFKPNATSTLSTSLSSGSSPLVSGLGRSAAGAVRSPVDAAGASLSCSPKAVLPGGSFTCEVTLDTWTSEALPVQTGSAQLRLPASVSLPGDQRTLAFQGHVDDAAVQESAIISAGIAGQEVKDTISILPASTSSIALPGPQLAIAGEPLSFVVAAHDPEGLPVELSVQGLPAGASFDAASGRFEWIPAAAQTGSHTVRFRVSGAANRAAVEQVRIEVGSGKPGIREVSLPAPGSIVRLSGDWLGPIDAEADPSGGSLELAGTRVKVNGTDVPVLSAGRTEVSFLCPEGMPGDSLEIVAQSPAGTSQPVRVAMREAAPALLTNGLGRSMILLAGTNLLATVRDVDGAGHPVRPGDLVVVRATGLNERLPVFVRIGGVFSQVRSVTPVSGVAGVWEILVAVPSGTAAGESVPVQILTALTGGAQSESDAGAIAVEAARP